MRRMKRKSDIINVIEFCMTINNWEYYISEIDENNIAFCLVDGFEMKMGYVDLEEIKPYITVRTKELDSIQPARGWKWINNGE